jgi:hypothetical protein
MSLIENDAAVRADYAARARTLLMHVIDKAALGQGPQGTPYREREFSTSDRSLFFGESFALTVDWIYATLTPADKAKIRTTFLRWINENLVATTSGLDHPEPVWTVNSPALLADPKRVRNAINNFYNAHMNQIGLMSMALDPADDVGALDSYGKGVTDYTANAIACMRASPDDEHVVRRRCAARRPCVRPHGPRSDGRVHAGPLHRRLHRHGAVGRAGPHGPAVLGLGDRGPSTLGESRQVHHLAG